MPIWRCYVKQAQLSKAEPYFEKVINAYNDIDKDELVPVQEAYECLPSEHPLISKLEMAENAYFR